MRRINSENLRLLAGPALAGALLFPFVTAGPASAAPVAAGPTTVQSQQANDDDEDYNKGYRDGYPKGFKDGYKFGYETSKAECLDEDKPVIKNFHTLTTETSPYTKGYKKGYDKGFDKGEKKGYDKAQERYCEDTEE